MQKILIQNHVDVNQPRATTAVFGDNDDCSLKKGGKLVQEVTSVVTARIFGNTLANGAAANITPDINMFYIDDKNLEIKAILGGEIILLASNNDGTIRNKSVNITNLGFHVSGDGNDNRHRQNAVGTPKASYANQDIQSGFTIIENAGHKNTVRFVQPYSSYSIDDFNIRQNANDYIDVSLQCTILIGTRN